MPDSLERTRHSQERGDIIRTLKEDYGRKTTVRTLVLTLDALGVPLSFEDLRFHLQYLEDQGYVELTRYRDTPGYRNDRGLPPGKKPDAIAFARLLPKGLNLLDGAIHPDPSITF